MEPIEWDPERDTRYQALSLAVDLFSRNPVRTSHILTIADQFVEYIKYGRDTPEFTKQVDPNQAELFVAQ